MMARTCAGFSHRENSDRKVCSCWHHAIHGQATTLPQDFESNNDNDNNTHLLIFTEI
jgi:hypothetical protein